MLHWKEYKERGYFTVNKQEAEAFFEENYRVYNETGTFLIAIHGPLNMLKDVQKESVIPEYLSKIRADQNQKSGTLLLDPAMDYASSIVEWIDLAANYPELEIAVTGAVMHCNSGGVSTYAWYSPAGSPELEGIAKSDPIGGMFFPAVFMHIDPFPPFPDFRNVCRFSAPLGLWEEEDHDGGWVAVWKNEQGKLGYTDLLDQQHMQWYDAEEINFIPPNVVAAVDLVSKLDHLKVNPEGKQVILDLWKVLFPDSNIHIQLEDGRYRYLDDAGGEYFLATSCYNETADLGVFFGKYTTDAEPLYGNDPVDWGFPPTSTWIPKKLLLVYKEFVHDEEDYDD